VELTPQSYWQATWEGKQSWRGFAFFEDIARFLPQQTGGRFMEIGCAPGRILAEFSARLGYEAHGIDYAADPAEIACFLRAEGVRVGAIERVDFLTWEPESRYDVVASFGFIEHFDDPAGIVKRHFDLVKPGGHVVLELPNFARGQKVLNWLFNRQTLRTCNTRCMSLAFMRGVARHNHARLLEARYVGGGFQFFIREEKRSWFWERILWRTGWIWKRLNRRFQTGSNAWFSPYIIAVFQAPPAEQS